VPCYGFEGLLRLAGMANLTMLRQHRRQPADGQKPVACYWSGHDYVALYREADAVDMPPLSPGRQRAYDRNRTCAECGKRSLDPWELGEDRKRYCPACQDPVHQRMWEQARAADRPTIAAWARDVLADRNVILGASMGPQWYREVHVVDLAGAVLLDAKIRFSTRADPEWLAKEHFAGTVSPDDPGIVERVRELASRRPVTWWPTTDLRRLAVEFDDLGRPVAGPVSTADGDRFGPWYDRWAGKIAGGSYRYQPRLANQPPPWDPREQIAEMRRILAEMAAWTPPAADRTEATDARP
jgi:hypothetical protein